jgi:hypothetical protein
MPTTSNAGSPFGTDLDKAVGILPSRSLRALTALFKHLEGVARKGRKSRCLPDEAESSERSTVPVGLKADGSDSIQLRDVGRQIISAAAAQIRLLELRAEESQFLLLINDWETAERIWLSLESDCRTPLYELSLLENLWDIDPGAFRVDGVSIERHRQKFVLIQLYIKMLLSNRENLLELSNTLETDLGCWLDQFARILDKLEYESTV